MATVSKNETILIGLCEKIADMRSADRGSDSKKIANLAEKVSPSAAFEAAFVLSPALRNKQNYTHAYNILRAMSSLVLRGTENGLPEDADPKKWQTIWDDLAAINNQDKKTMAYGDGNLARAASDIFDVFDARKLDKGAKPSAVPPPTPPIPPAMPRPAGDEVTGRKRTQGRAAKPPAQPPVPPAPPPAPPLPPVKPPVPPAPPTPEKIVIHGRGELIRACVEISELYVPGRVQKNTQAIQDRLNAIYDYLGYPEDPKVRRNFNQVKSIYDGLSDKERNIVDQHRKDINTAAISGLLNAFKGATIIERQPFSVALAIFDAASEMIRHAPHDIVVERFASGQDPLRTVLDGVLLATDPQLHPECMALHSKALSLVGRLDRKEGEALTMPEIMEELKQSSSGLKVEIRISKVYRMGPESTPQSDPDRPAYRRVPKASLPAPAPGGGKKR